MVPEGKKYIPSSLVVSLEEWFVIKVNFSNQDIILIFINHGRRHWTLMVKEEMKG